MINNLNQSIIMTTDEEDRCLFLIAQLEELISDVREQHKEIREQHREIREQCDEVREQHREIREQQTRLQKDVEEWKKQGEEDLKFFQNLNAQFKVDFPHLKQQPCF